MIKKIFRALSDALGHGREALGTLERKNGFKSELSKYSSIQTGIMIKSQLVI